MDSKTLDILALCLTLIGSTILVLGFTPQSKKIYTLKHTYGISKISWIQNYVGRIVYSIYCTIALGRSANDTANLATLPTIIGQLLVGAMSVAVVYYTIRNTRTSGEYKKEHFNRNLFATRIAMDIFLAVAAVVIILMSSTINVIHILPKNSTSHGMLIFNTFFGFFACAIVSGAFIPQSIKTIRTRNTKSTSLALTIMFAIGNSLLALMFVVKAINAGMHDKVDTAWKVAQYAGSIFFITIGVIAMTTIIAIKLANMKKGIDSPKKATKTTKVAAQK